MNRRRFVQSGALASIAPARIFGAPAHSEQSPDMLLSFLSQRLNKLAADWDKTRAGIHSAADVEARNRFVREKAREMVHGFPDRNPLHPVTVAKHERGDYRVENVMFQSRPNFWVTGNLYIPTKGAGP